MSFEILDLSLVLRGGFFRVESPEIAPLPGVRISLARIDTIFA
jgi:hypothetical protein